MNDMFDQSTPPKPQDTVPVREQAATEPSPAADNSGEGRLTRSANPAAAPAPLTTQPAHTGPQCSREQASSQPASQPISSSDARPITQADGLQARPQSTTTTQADTPRSTLPAAEPRGQPSPESSAQSGPMASAKPDLLSDSQRSLQPKPPVVQEPTMQPTPQLSAQDRPASDPVPVRDLARPSSREPVQQNGSRLGAQADQHSGQQGGSGAAEQAASASVRPAGSSPANIRSQGASSAAPAAKSVIGNWADMSPAQKQDYIAGTKTRGSRKKARPSLDRHRDLIVDCVKGQAAMRQVFNDLCAIDPAVVVDFGKNGHRRFAAAAKDLARK